ncbi:vacuolar-type H+-ATPase subunit E/Vma4 [Amycolatopsis lexingtonensis]|uniref:Vacuolar-type H+-ATPase subunit E/Vma4 n=1 Tax=Amycolatopsis lexingtonensis TaxID=218822 RepID=A0ABR9HSX1_9PSEU|nr:hypothetical protein [Amycolatopsis lexingtonensis]MBE1494023.1 vacuolar-type H+-ATPase subunit E/Vma4 [Amycolatopsis lexingtonensis]
MPAIRDLLDRFRPAGTPGAAARPGVPADRRTEAAAELEPVLASLDDTQARVAEIRREAAKEASRRRREALARAEAIVAQARIDAASARADAALRVRREGTAEATALAETAAAEADRVRALIAERMPALVEHVLGEARSILDQLGHPDRTGAR